MNKTTNILAQKSRERCRKKFLYYFKKGFTDPKYINWERQYKLDAHFQFQAALNKTEFSRMLRSGRHEDIALKAVRIESKTNLLFSFEKMALRDAVKEPEGAKNFAQGLFQYIYGSGTLKNRFQSFTYVLAMLLRRQTRVLTWPLHTVFGFLANPKEHIFLKPRVAKIAAEKYGYEFSYKSMSNWDTYNNFLKFAEQVRKDISDLKPQDYIDLQSFLWVLGSEEYPD